MGDLRRPSPGLMACLGVSMGGTEASTDVLGGSEVTREARKCMDEVGQASG